MTTASLAAAAGLSLFAGTMVYAAFADLLTMRIGNRIPALLVVAYGPAALAAGLPLAIVATSVLVAFLVLATGFIFFSRGWIGGGDAKLASAATLWLGSDQALPYLAVVALAGCALTLLFLSFRLAPLLARLDDIKWLRRLHSRQAGIPYGIALAAGTLLLVPQSRWMALVHFQ